MRMSAAPSYPSMAKPERKGVEVGEPRGVLMNEKLEAREVVGLRWGCVG